MSPKKRKGTAASKAGSPKRPKIVVSQTSQTDAEELGKTEASWVLPPEAEKSTSPDLSEVTTRCARALYEQDYQALPSAIWSSSIAHTVVQEQGTQHDR
jgi:hypothetical protein